MKFIIISPIKNESQFIKQNIDSVLKQTVLPSKWIIVDDGSTDDTFELVKKRISEYNWIELVKHNTNNESRSGGSKVVRAFNYGLNKTSINSYDFIVKLDGDLILPNNYFENILEEFRSDPDLGICGGTIYNSYSENDLRIEKVTDFHVRGALKMIRRECWMEINGFKEVWNWDGLDIMEAQYHGWKTRSIDIPVIHLRPTSSAYDPVEHAYKSGYESYKMGADLTLTLIRSIFKFKIKPFFLCGFNYIKGYFDALIRKEKLIVSKDLAKFINKKHYSRIIPFKI